MNEITLNVPQGIGDIFWIYQKFAPHVDRIRFNVMHFGVAPLGIQMRALDFLKLFPKTQSAEPLEVTEARYERVWRSYFPMKNIFEHFKHGHLSFDYGCNRKLEQSVRIEAIDPDYRIEETVPLTVEPAGLPFKKYVTAYVPGAVVHEWAVEKGMWPVSRWADLIFTLYRKKKLLYPVLVIGASFDQEATVELSKRLREGGIESAVAVAFRPAAVIHILKETVFFVGHQSGLNILADNLDTRQLMLYMATLEGLRYSWPKKSHLSDGTFTAGMFSETSDEIVERVSFPAGNGQ